MKKKTSMGGIVEESRWDPEGTPPLVAGVGSGSPTVGMVDPAGLGPSLWRESEGQRRG